MVLGLVACSLGTSRYVSLSVSVPFLRRHFRGMKETQMDFGGERQKFWHHFGSSLSCQSCVPGCRNFRVEAGWPFSRSDQGSDASSERSENANEDILMFFFQLDLATRVQVSPTRLFKFIVYRFYIRHLTYLSK